MQWRLAVSFVLLVASGYLVGALVAQEIEPQTHDVTDYGAVCGDQGDDREAFQAASDAAADGDRIYFPECDGGEYLVTPNPDPSWQEGVRFRKRLELYGDGRERTRIAMMPGDWRSVGDFYLFGFKAGAHDIVVRDLTLDGHACPPPGIPEPDCVVADERTILLNLRGVAGGLIERVNLIDSFGDAVAMLSDEQTLPGGGKAFPWTTDVLVRHVYVEGSRRGGVLQQSQTRDCAVEDSTFVGLADAAWDNEPTVSLDSARPTDNAFRRNVIRHHHTKTVAVSTSGSLRAVLEDNVIDGAVEGVNVWDARIANNTISGRPQIAPGETPLVMVKFRGDSRGVVIEGNTVYGEPGAAAMQVAPLGNGSAPSDMDAAGNTVFVYGTNDANGAAVSYNGVASGSIVGNTAYDASGSSRSGYVVQTTINDSDQIAVVGNATFGFLRPGQFIAGSGGDLRHLVVVANQASSERSTTWWYRRSAPSIVDMPLHVGNGGTVSAHGGLAWTAGSDVE